MGGGVPRIGPVSLGRKALVAFYYGGELFEYNFTKIIPKSSVNFGVTETEDCLIWRVSAKARNHKLEAEFSAPKNCMVKCNYENPLGVKNHSSLWNTGLASGTIVFWKRLGGNWIEIDKLHGTFAGAEYGEHASS